REALRLFGENGFDRTTVERISQAAEISTATFYRYFSSKEDVVLSDDYDPMLEEALASRPEEEPLPVAVRAALRSAASRFLEPDRNEILARLQLIYSVPDLQVHLWHQRTRNVTHVSQVLASRTKRDPDEYEVRIAASVLVSVVSETVLYWVRCDGEPPL